MARAYPSQRPHDYGQDPQGGDWQALRGELSALLEEVESQVARTARQPEAEHRSISERMQDLRYQLAEAEPDTRHREALRSVKRAVERFSERDDPYGQRADTYPPNPRDTLQSAIQQIRSRHGSYAEPSAPRRTEPQFENLAQAVSGISARLERFESELHGAARAQTGNVKEIAEQVAQLSHVVELLAGAVGETGQVKRIETQLAGLVRLISEGPKVDLDSVTRRLDDLGTHVSRLTQRQHDEGLGLRLDDISATVGRLADLQVQFADRVGESAQSSAGFGKDLRAAGDSIKDEVGAVALGLQKSMTAIEEAVRNVYDRIDAVERRTTVDPAALERLTDDMASFTEAMKNPQQVETILELVESIHRRISAIEGPQREVGELKLDMEALRATVIEAMEPRFAALEMQIEALNDRVGGGGPSGDISVSQLEAQVRQLVARMDQTGEQLTGLARLYSTPVERNEPDYEALADLVASRTSEAVAQFAPPPAGGAQLSDSGIEEIERRISRLLNSARRDSGGSEDISTIEGSIHEVNDRLARLEQSLSAREEMPAAAAPLDVHAPEPEAKAPAIETPAVPTSEEPPAHEDDPIAPLIAQAASAAMAEARGTSSRSSVHSTDRDAMPASPSDDAPLRDRPFADEGGPIRAALEAKNGPRKLHPGLSYEPLPGQGLDDPMSQDASAGATGRPDFDPASVELPPRPVSSFDAPRRGAFDEPAPAAPQPAEDAAVKSTPSTNTFIAAARRAAQRQQQPETSGGSGSLIARALASFQQTKDDAAKPDQAPAPAGKQAKKEKKPKGRMARLLAGDKEARTEWKPDDSVPLATPEAPSAPEPVALDQEATSPVLDGDVKESFLSRHRRPILLAAALIAVALLTYNLIQQRMSNGEAPAPEPATDVSGLESGTTSPLSGEPVSTMSDAVSGPRVIPIVDSLATASIDAATAERFTPATELPAMPMAFAAAAETADPAAEAKGVEVASLAPLAETVTPLAAELESPVTVELPPAGLGPEPLRKAAAEGDARAQFEVAAIYTEGRAVPEDLAAAAVWYERAAAQGFAPAQYRLGNLYENGRGVDKDLQLARLWYQRAAEAGNRMAMHNLAALYAGGDLGKQEFNSAAEWFEQAAIRGMRDSQFNLGMLYARGLGVPQSLEDSYKWFSLAALRGDTDAAKARDDVARSLDAEAVGRLDDEIEKFVLATIDLGANFAPIGTWSDAFDAGETITNAEIVKSVQAALGALGYDVGAPDGVTGPRTTQAIKAFETATGMSVSGAVNPRLLAVLGSQPV